MNLEQFELLPYWQKVERLRKQLHSFKETLLKYREIREVKGNATFGYDFYYKSFRCGLRNNYFKIMSFSAENKSEYYHGEQMTDGVSNEEVIENFFKELE